VVNDIKARAKKITGTDEVAQVGSIAANGDKSIGKIDRRGDEAGRQRGRDHGEEAKSSTPSSTSSRACSSTAAISRRTFITNADKRSPSSTRRTSCCSKEALGPAGDAAGARGGRAVGKRC